MTGRTCDGEIDYDCGFNHLVCTKCGKVYLACNLRDDSIENNIVIKGGSTMKVTITRGKDVLTSSIKSEEVIKRPAPETPKAGVVKAEVVNVPVANTATNRFGSYSRASKFPSLNVSVTKGNTTLVTNEEKDKNEEATAEVKKVSKLSQNMKRPTKKNANTGKANVKVVSVDEVTEDKEAGTVNIKVTAEIKPNPEEEKEVVVESPVEESTTTEEAEITDVESEEETVAEGDETVDEIDEKYGDLYDDEENFSRKQPVRSKSTKKPSDGDDSPKKKTTTRIPKK